MNEKTQEKVMHCLEKTGLLAIWAVNEQAKFVPKAFAGTSRLFPGNNNNNDSGSAKEEDGNSPAFPRSRLPASIEFSIKLVCVEIHLRSVSHDFSCAIVTRMNSETGEITTKEADEAEEVENELVAAVVANAKSGKTLFNYFEVVLRTSDCVFCCRLVCRRWGSCSQGRRRGVGEWAWAWGGRGVGVGVGVVLPLQHQGPPPLRRL